MISQSLKMTAFALMTVRINGTSHNTGKIGRGSISSTTTTTGSNSTTSTDPSLTSRSMSVIAQGEYFKPVPEVISRLENATKTTCTTSTSTIQSKARRHKKRSAKHNSNRTVSEQSFAEKTDYDHVSQTQDDSRSESAATFTAATEDVLNPSILNAFAAEFWTQGDEHGIAIEDAEDEKCSEIESTSSKCADDHNELPVQTGQELHYEDSQGITWKGTVTRVVPPGTFINADRGTMSCSKVGQVEVLFKSGAGKELFWYSQDKDGKVHLTILEGPSLLQKPVRRTRNHTPKEKESNIDNRAQLINSAHKHQKFGILKPGTLFQNETPKINHADKANWKSWDPQSKW